MYFSLCLGEKNTHNYSSVEVFLRVKASVQEEIIRATYSINLKSRPYCLVHFILKICMRFWCSLAISIEERK